MSRPENITDSHIKRWDEAIKNDTNISKIKISPLLREVIYAGLFLMEELEKEHCSPELCTRISYTAGKMSFGRDPWEITFMLLEKYRNQELILEDDPTAQLS